MQNLRTSANKGSNDAYDVSVSLTGYEPNFMAFSELNDSSGSFSYIIPSSDQDMDDVTLGKLLTEAHRGQADYCEPEGMSVSQSSSSVVFDGAGKHAGERNVDQSVGFGVTRNTYSAHSKFSENTQAEKVVDRLGKPEERNSSNAQIRTLLEAQRQMIIAEYCEKVSHHELQAAHAEEQRRIPREELWRQKLEFREVHQQSLTEMEELRKFQSSTFDTIARRKLIEDQNTILELSGRVQELQNEVNCMNDSKDFQDAESVRSGNSHVTSRPVSFSPHPIPEGMLRHSFVSPRRKEGPPSIWDIHGISGNVFANPHASSSAPHPQELLQWSAWPEGWGPQGRRTTGGGGLARVPNLRVCKHLFHWRWHMQGGKDELTSCRGTVQWAWQKPPVRRKGGRAGLPARVSGRHVVRGRQSSPSLEVRLGEQARLVKTVNIQVRWAAAQPGQDRLLPSVATHSRL